jgi:hypothetical protein
VTGTGPSASAPESRDLGWRRPVIAAVATNALPAIGVLFLGWNAAAFVLYYALDCAVLGSLTIVEIARLEDGTPIWGAGFGQSALTAPLPRTRYYRLIGGLVVVSALVALALTHAAFPSGGARLTVVCALTLLVGRALVEYRSAYVGERQYVGASSSGLAERFFLRFALLPAMVAVIAVLERTGLARGVAGRLGVFLLVVAWAATDVWRARAGATPVAEGAAPEGDAGVAAPSGTALGTDDVRGGPML